MVNGMARRGRLRLYVQTPEELVRTRVVPKIRASAEVWVNNTVTGFETNWVKWGNHLAVGLAPTLQKIYASPPGEKIEDRVKNRVIPVAEKIHDLSVSYKQEKMRKIVESLTRTGAGAGAGAGAGTPPPTIG